MRALALTSALLALLCAPTARAETSVYVAEQPGLSLLLKAEGEAVYATYLRAVIVCRGGGSHWFETDEARHWAFQNGPAKLRRSEGRLRLVQADRSEFGSSREVIAGEIQPGRFVGTFSLFASGEGAGGSCESNAPGFEPELGEREPPVPFEAQRYVPLGSALAMVPDPAAPALYFSSSTALETYLWTGDGAVTRIDGTAERFCRSRGRKPVTRRSRLGLKPPYSLDANLAFDARAAYDYGFKARFARMTGSVDAAGASGMFRATSTEHSPLIRCRTGRPGGDGWLSFHATRYVPVALPGAG